MEPKYLIYVLCEPQDRLGSKGRQYRAGEIRYVGLSTRGMKRPKEHRRPSCIKQNNTKVNKWLRCLRKIGLLPEIEVIESYEETDPQKLKEAERFYIAYFKSLGFSLTNSTDGGDGLLGFNHTEISKQKMSKSRRENGWKPSAEFIEHDRLAQKTRRPVIDSQGIIYPSVKYAATVLEVDRSTIVRAIRRRGIVGSLGISFSFLDDNLQQNSFRPKKIPKKRISWEIVAVIDSDGREFSSTVRAASFHGVTKRTVYDSIVKARPSKKTGKSFYWKPSPVLAPKK